MKVGVKRATNKHRKEKIPKLLSSPTKVENTDLRKFIIDKTKEQLSIFSDALETNLNGVQSILEEYDILSDAFNSIEPTPGNYSMMSDQILSPEAYDKLSEVLRKEYMLQRGYSGIREVIEKEKKLWTETLYELENGKKFYEKTIEKPLLEIFDDMKTKHFYKKASKLNSNIIKELTIVVTRAKNSTFDYNFVGEFGGNFSKKPVYEKNGRIGLIIHLEKNIVSNFINFSYNFDSRIDDLLVEIGQVEFWRDYMKKCSNSFEKIFQSFANALDSTKTVRNTAIVLYQRSMTTLGSEIREVDKIKKEVEFLRNQENMRITLNNDYKITQIRQNQFKDNGGTIFSITDTNALDLGYYIVNNFIDIRNGNFSISIKKIY